MADLLIRNATLVDGRTGIDFGVPYGTPIRAAGSGKLEVAGTATGGAGSVGLRPPRSRNAGWSGLGKTYLARAS